MAEGRRRTSETAAVGSTTVASSVVYADEATRKNDSL